MKRNWISLVVTLAVLSLSLNLAFAAEPAKPAAKPVAAKADAKAPIAKQEPVDINSATDAELKAIPGLGDAYIAKIVVNRPFANKAQLVSRKILPESVYEKVKDRIIAKQPKKNAAKPATKAEPKKK